MQSIMEHCKKAVRPRKVNCTNNEILALIDAYGRRKSILQGIFKSTLSNRDKKVAWDVLAADVNAAPSSRRTPDELKKKWQKLNSKHPGMGGGSSAKESPYTDLIADIFGEVSALIDSVEGGMDVGDEGIFAYDAETGYQISQFCLKMSVFYKKNMAGSSFYATFTWHKITYYNSRLNDTCLTLAVEVTRRDLLVRRF